MPGSPPRTDGHDHVAQAGADALGRLRRAADGDAQATAYASTRLPDATGRDPQATTDALGHP
ncbi:hypothetical protein [Amycolatopsis sp. lyj-109]|uniref:hypothetical protein n=1 Tax=Amycolatopsis sp. lyj-109 TaxID=2789287 RepID=UPI00397A936E